MEFIACAFKMTLQKIRTAIKEVDTLLEKSKFELKRQILEKYRVGLLADLRKSGDKLCEVIKQNCVEIAGAPETLIYFLKLWADIKRYLAEHSRG